MTELDQAPAATETSDQPPAGEQRPGSTDSQARYPNGVSAADQDPSYYDGDVQAALAADGTPTRQQAARDTGSTDHQDGDRIAGTSPDAAASGRDPYIDAILHENDHLPEPRTRQEAAREKADGQTVEVTPAESPDSSASGHAPDIEAILHENDHLPEPRTRQEAARDAGGAQREGRGPDPLAHSTATNDPPTSADYGTSRDPADRDQPFTVAHIGPEERTLGDTTPTGIGLKPSGDQLLDMENETDSPLARMRHHLYKDMDDVTDVLKENGETVASLMGERPPTGTHSEIPSGQPEITRPAEHGTEAGQIAVAGLVVGMLTYEGARRVKNMVEARKGRRS